MPKVNDIDNFDEDEILDELKEFLDEERFKHSLNVRDLALKLAEGKGIKRQRIVAAALLHDIAKGMEIEEMFRYAASNGIPLGPGHLVNPKTLHQNVGAAMARRKFGITDAPVLSAISKHATADAHMTTLDIILYVADSLEKDRDFEGVDELREAALRDLDEAYYQTLRRTMIYVLERSLYLDERSVRAYNHACIKRDKRIRGEELENEENDRD
jgi:predicted HD superfamily hydrolase involved in NAD metabolism